MQLHTRLRPGLRLIALTLAVSLVSTPGAQAQNSEGSIFGRAAAGTAIVVLNLDNGLRRQHDADAGGNFSFSRLPPGRYKVSGAGQEREVLVGIGSGTEVRLGTQELERVAVTGLRGRSAIDVSSVESNSVFTAEQLRALPVARNVNAVALLAPGVVKGDPGFGGLPSFGGSSVAENGYYINGFDVTNIRNFTSYASLPFDAVAQQQMKTGGYGAEYGRSLGGVVSLLTRRGDNEWKAGGAIFHAPDSLRSRSKDVKDLDPDHNATFQNYTVFASANKATPLSFDAYVSGPLVKDRLFVFALVQGRRDTSDSFALGTSTRTLSNKPNGLLKLDWAINDAHLLEYTGITDKYRTVITDYTQATRFGTSHSGAGRDSLSTHGSDVSILKYTAHLSDRLTVSALIGRVRHQDGLTTGARQIIQDCPVVLDTDLSEIGCWTKPFSGPFVRGLDQPQVDSDRRRAGRLDLEYVLGAHTLRAGYDAQRFDSVHGGGSYFTGGYYWRYFISGDGIVNGVANVVPPGGQYVRRREHTTSGGSYAVANTALYLEDSWKIDPRWLIYGGLRSESFENKNAAGTTFVKASHLLAPRLGLAWDVKGDASLKVYGNAGRYFIPVASNTNIRGTGAEKFEHRFYTFQSRDPRTQGPLGLSASDIGVPLVNSTGQLPDPGAIADTRLRPMNQDEIILGFQRALSKSLSFGAKAVYRKVNDGMDDNCGRYAQKQWATEQGFTAYNAKSSPLCILVNPGRDVNIKLDLQGTGKLTEVSIPASYWGMAKYQRTYKALELTLDRPFDGRWSGQASYVWSRSRGTAEGYVQSTLQQADAGMTQDFDFGSFSDGAYGDLPNDRRHVIKAFGSYQLTNDLRMGANLIVSSGRALSCIGYVPHTVPDFNKVDGTGGAGDYPSASSYYCIDPATRQSVLKARGSAGRTPWTGQLDLQLAYTPSIAGFGHGGKGRITLQMDVFNVLNSQRVTRQYEVRDYSRNTTTAIEGKLHPNYGNPTNFQDPRSVQLTARYEF